MRKRSIGRSIYKTSRKVNLITKGNKKQQLEFTHYIFKNMNCDGFVKNCGYTTAC